MKTRRKKLVKARKANPLISTEIRPCLPQLAPRPRLVRSGSASIQDLCAEDKAKIGNLIRQTVTLDEMGAKFAKVTGTQKKHFERELNILKQKNKAIVGHTSSIRKRFKEAVVLLNSYRQQLQKAQQEQSRSAKGLARVKDLELRVLELTQALEASRKPQRLAALVKEVDEQSAASPPFTTKVRNGVHRESKAFLAESRAHLNQPVPESNVLKELVSEVHGLRNEISKSFGGSPSSLASKWNEGKLASLAEPLYQNNSFGSSWARNFKANKEKMRRLIEIQNGIPSGHSSPGNPLYNPMSVRNPLEPPLETRANMPLRYPATRKENQEQFTPVHKPFNQNYGVASAGRSQSSYNPFYQSGLGVTPSHSCNPSSSASRHISTDQSSKLSIVNPHKPVTYNKSQWDVVGPSRIRPSEVSEPLHNSSRAPKLVVSASRSPIIPLVRAHDEIAETRYDTPSTVRPEWNSHISHKVRETPQLISKEKLAPCSRRTRNNSSTKQLNATHLQKELSLASDDEITLSVCLNKDDIGGRPSPTRSFRALSVSGKSPKLFTSAMRSEKNQPKLLADLLAILEEEDE